LGGMCLSPFRSLRGRLSWFLWLIFFPYPSCAFSPVVLLSHLAFLCPLVFIILITSSCSLTSPHRNWLVPLACFPTFPHALGMYFPTDINPNPFDPCIYRGPRGYLDAHSQPHPLPLLDSLSPVTVTVAMLFGLFFLISFFF